MTSRQRPQSFRELVADLYVYSVSFRGLARILDLLGCGVGAAALWRDVPAMLPGRRPDPQAGLAGGGRDLAVHRWRKATGGHGPWAQGPAAGPAVEWSRLRWGRLVHGSGPAGTRVLTTDDDPVYEPALDASGLDRQQCAVHMQRTVERHLRGLDEDTLTHLDQVLLPILQRLVRERSPEAGPVLLELWQAVAQGRVPLDPEVRQRLWHLVSRWNDPVRSQHNPKVSATTNQLEGWLGRLKPRARLTRGLKTEVGALNFVGLMARAMA